METKDRLERVATVLTATAPDPVLVWVVWGLAVLVVVLWLASLWDDDNHSGDGDHRWNGRPK